MKAKKYSKIFKLNVVKEALKDEYKNNISIVAKKYGLRELTVERWRYKYLKYGDKGLSIGFNPNTINEKNKYKNKDEELRAKDKKIKELKEEIKILKEAADFFKKFE